MWPPQEDVPEPDVEARLQEIRDNIGDPERAHLLEFRFRSDILRFIASHRPDAARAAELAGAAISTAAIVFPRWYGEATTQDRT